jgi:hypothetical protein
MVRAMSSVGYRVTEQGFSTRVRLVKTENHSACVTVNCKFCKSARAMYCL